MSAITPLIPRQQVPSLEVPTVGGGTWSLADQKPEKYTMVVFYRGLHCPICSMYLGDLNRKAGQFAEKGVTVIVVSSDDEARATEAKDKWGLDQLTVAYGMSMEKAREWGLYISTSKGKTSTGHMEPPLFSEPGIFFVKPDNTLYFANVQTMPFARPAFGDILKALDFVIERDYPARGEVVDHTQEASQAAE